MFNWLTNPDVLLGGLVLAGLQLLAAVPWLRAIDPFGFDKSARTTGGWLTAAGVLLAGTVFAAAFLGYRGDSSNLRLYGRVYGAVLHAQMLLALFLLFPHALARVWRKGGAVALAAYREAWRQPMFWLILLAALAAVTIAIVLPYFTFGDDFKMMKQIGFDIAMLAPALFGVLAAAQSIAEEIEGRTAMTVLSKPVNRRSFLLGKFVGLLLACGAMTLMIGWWLTIALIVMPEFDPINKDRAFDPMPEQAKFVLKPVFLAAVPPFGTAVTVGPAKALADGASMWFGETAAHTVGLALGFGQVAILVAIAAALATRLAFVVNLVVCLVVYFLGHLAPVVVRVTESQSGRGTGAAIVQFLGNVFDTLLPGLEFFNNGPAIIRENPLALGAFSAYVVTVCGYALLYTAIALLIGLLLFEDRDLA